MDIKRCISCLWCFESMLSGGFEGVSGGCAVNPRACREYQIPAVLKQGGNGKTVAVIGAGPAGLMAAETLGRRGFKPVVFEKAGVPGGQLQLAQRPPGKEKIAWCYQDLEYAAKKNGADIRYHTEATLENLKDLEPYAVILASGAESLTPKIDGACGDNVCTVTQVLDGSVVLSGKRVAVIGSGMSGLETAEILCAHDNTVTIVDMADEIAPGMYHQHLDDVLPKLKKNGVMFMTGSKLMHICDGSIRIQHKDGREESLPADNVVLSVGVKSCDGMAEELKGAFKNFFVVGDAKEIGRISFATLAAYDAACALD